jgi:hypothetical protein
MICLHTTWLVAPDFRSETCADCGQLRILPNGTPQFVDEPWKDRPVRVGDPKPVSDEYKLVGWRRARV